MFIVTNPACKLQYHKNHWLEETL